MVSSAWFFSTLAQATAAIVGFVITVSTVQYQLEKQRRQARTEDLRQELFNFKRKYDSIIPSIAGEFADGAYKPLGISPIVFSLSNDEIEYVLKKQASKPTQSILWIHLTRISNLTTFELEPSSDPEEHYLLSDSEFEAMSASIEWLDSNFKENTDTIDNLYQNLGISGKSKPYLADKFDPDPPQESVQEWLNEHQPYTAQTPTVFTGENLQSFRRVVEEMKNDFEELDALRKNTIINFEPQIFRVLVVSSLLIVVGVFLPSSALVTDIPSNLSYFQLSGIYLFAYQLVLTVITASLTLYLLVLLKTNI